MYEVFVQSTCAYAFYVTTILSLEFDSFLCSALGQFLLAVVIRRIDWLVVSVSLASDSIALLLMACRRA